MKRLTIIAMAAVAASAYASDADQMIRNLAAQDVVKSAAAYTGLVELGRDAVKPLIYGLNSRDEMVRTQCARALAEIGTPAMHGCISVLDSSEWRVRAFSALALGEMRNSRAVSALTNVLQADSDWWVRSQAAVALGTIGSPAALSALMAATSDPDTRVQSRAVYAVEAIRHGGAGIPTQP